MKRHLPIFFLLVLLFLATLLCSCGATPPGETEPPEPPETVYYTVQVRTDDPNCYIVGDTSVTVEMGGTARFRVMLAQSYVLEPLLGSYDPINGYYTVDGVSEDLTITLCPIYAETYTVTVFDAASGVSGRHSVRVGESLTLRPNPAKGEFVAWTVGARLTGGGSLLSSEAELEFTPSGAVSLYANYATGGVRYLLYDLNGGTTDTGAATYLQVLDTSFYSAPNALGDRGIFSRDGYALMEYNTEPDGSGVGYSLGSKIKLTGGATTLYCIWAEETDARLFTTRSTAVSVGGRAVTGLAITGYSGSASEIVIPEEINGKPVIQIANGAFKDLSVTRLFLTHNLLEVQKNAFSGCGNLQTIYFSDSIVKIPDDALDEASYQSLRDLYINAVREPVFCAGYDGAYRVKWDRLMEASDGDMIVYIAGSSALHGISTEYIEALLDGGYTFVNYGTISGNNGMVYMEAVSHFVDEGDIVIWGPEDTEYQYGARRLNYKLYRDLEGSLNVFRYIDIGNYEGVFSAFTQYQEARLDASPSSYDRHGSHIDENGDFHNSEHKLYNQKPYTIPPFEITLADMRARTGSDRVPFDTHRDFVCEVIGQIKNTGARVYFAFCSMDAGALTASAKTPEVQATYERMIRQTFGIETLGTVSSYIYETRYLYRANESSYHLNDYGRAINTYRLYVDLCEKLSLTPKGYLSLGTDFDGCNFK